MSQRSRNSQPPNLLPVECGLWTVEETGSRLFCAEWSCTLMLGGACLSLSSLLVVGSSMAGGCFCGRGCPGSGRDTPARGCTTGPHCTSARRRRPHGVCCLSPCVALRPPVCRCLHLAWAATWNPNKKTTPDGTGGSPRFHFPEENRRSTWGRAGSTLAPVLVHDKQTRK